MRLLCLRYVLDFAYYLPYCWMAVVVMRTGNGSECNNISTIKRVNPVISAYLKLSPETSPVEWLQQNGFTYCGYCNCSGTKNYKYSKNEYIIYYLPKPRLYHIKLQNHYLDKNQPLSTLCQKLRSLGIVNSESLSAS